jgi:predicted nucleic acid-binding protein
MPDKYFLDTNIFVYSFDDSVTDKKERARALVDEALSSHLGVISSQVAQEFLNVATRKFASPMNEQQAIHYLDTVLLPLCDVFTSADLFKESLSIRAETGFSFYDSLILAAACVTGCKAILTEDMQSGRLIRGVEIQNPFAAIR